MRRLEAVLFLAREPLGSRRLSDYAGLADGTEARTLVRKLNERYDQSERPYRVQQIAEGFQIRTRPQFARWLRRLAKAQPLPMALSAPALETLTVIAYRQPILKADIEAIRGVGCSEMLRQLMERDLVRISGRSSELGRPFLYSTTRNFLQTFGLSGLDALPRADQLRGMGLPNWASPSQNQDANPNETTSAIDNSEESNVRLSASALSLEELKFSRDIGMAIGPVASALDVRNTGGDEDEEDLEDDGLDDDEEDDEEEEELEEEDDDGDWEEIDDDEEWDEEDDEEDEEWDDEDEEEDDDWE